MTLLLGSCIFIDILNLTRVIGMQHKISEFCDKIKVMCIKAEQLRSMKYDTPKEKRNENKNKSENNIFFLDSCLWKL